MQFLMKPKLKQIVAALQLRWLVSAELKEYSRSHSAYRLWTKLKFQINCPLLVVLCMCYIVVFCSWNASVTSALAWLDAGNWQTADTFLVFGASFHALWFLGVSRGGNENVCEIAASSPFFPRPSQSHLLRKSLSLTGFDTACTSSLANIKSGEV